jgi:hypothetical protein
MNKPITHDVTTGSHDYFTITYFPDTQTFSIMPTFFADDAEPNIMSLDTFITTFCNVNDRLLKLFIN